MKNKYYILVIVQFLFCTCNLKTSLLNQKFDRIEELNEIYLQSKMLYQTIDPSTISKTDDEAYQALVHLTVRTHDYYFAIEQSYSDMYCKSTKEFYDQAVSNAQKISSTKNPVIFEALKATLLYAEKRIKIKSK